MITVRLGNEVESMGCVVPYTIPVETPACLQVRVHTNPLIVLTPTFGGCGKCGFTNLPILSHGKIHTSSLSSEYAH